MMRQAARILLIACLAALSAATVYYAVDKTLDPTGGIDFHSYWYSGHFIRQRADPYGAYLQGLVPEAPVRYLDGSTGTQPIAQPGLATVPANTAPMVIALSGLSLLSWPTAKLAWLVVNLALMLIIPALVIRLLPESPRIDGYTKAVIYLAFIGLFGTRNTAGNGQTSLLVFALMLAAVLALRRSWPAAGIWLGLGLSKYSLSLPVLIYFIIKRQYRAAVLALLVQLAAAVLLAAWAGASPWTILVEYLGILQVHAALPGIHLGSLFPQTPTAGTLAAVVLTLASAASLFAGKRKLGISHELSEGRQKLVDLHVLTALTLWTLLVAYHRAYDSFVAILFFALVIYGLSRAPVWRLSGWQSTTFGIGTALAYIPLSLPARGITFITGALPDESLLRWLDFQGGLLTLTLLAMLAAVLWLFPRLCSSRLDEIPAGGPPAEENRATFSASG